MQRKKAEEWLLLIRMLASPCRDRRSCCGFGHIAALKAVQAFIHYRAVASLPRLSVDAKIEYAEDKEITPTDFQKSVGVRSILFDKLEFIYLLYLFCLYLYLAKLCPNIKKPSPSIDTMHPFHYH